MGKFTYTKNAEDMKKQYTEYINNHINNVKLCYEKAIDAFRIVFPEIYEDEKQLGFLLGNLQNHDESKFSPHEFYHYGMRFFPMEGIDPDDKFIINNFELAWLHHVHNNPHHPGYWVLVEDNKIKIFDMPDIYIIEMLCDWMAMSVHFNSSTEDYWNSDSAKKLPMSEYTKSKVNEFMENMNMIININDRTKGSKW